MLDFEKPLLERCAFDILNKEEEMVLSVFKKKQGFVSFEESKHLISANKIIYTGIYIKTEYLFKDKVVLVVHAPKYEFVDYTFKATVEYEEIF